MTTHWRRAGRIWIWLVALAGAAGPLRAQMTEFPQTIDPGKILVRMDALSLGLNRDTAVEHQYTALGLASTVVSTGVTPDFDVQAAFQLFVRETYQLGGTDTSHSGLGDVALRVKWAFWKDDAANAAAAVIPYVKLPTHRAGVGNGRVEGGIIVPWARAVVGGCRAGAMFEWDVQRNVANTAYSSRWLASGYVQRDVTSAIGVYGEASFDISSTNASTFGGTMGGGVTVKLSPNVQWDYSLNRGVGGGATDWTGVLRLRWKL